MEKVALNTRQLDQLTFHHPTLAPYFGGTHPCDGIPDPAKVSHPQGFIVNTDPSDLPGRHWLGVWIEENKCELFDSFGLDLELYETADPLIKWLDQFSFVKRNGKSVQSLYDQSCDDYALMFLVAKSQDETMREFEKRFPTNYVANDRKVGEFIKNLIAKERRWQEEARLYDEVDGPRKKKTIQGSPRSLGGVRHLIPSESE